MNNQDAEKIAQYLDRWYTRLGKQYGSVSRSQRRMLKAIEQVHESTVGGLADRLGQTVAGATRMLDKLENAGLVMRVRQASEDQRQVNVQLTGNGKEVLSSADRLYYERIRLTLGSLSDEEIGVFLSLMGKIGSSFPD